MFFILFPLVKSHLALLAVGLHCSFPLHLLQEGTCALSSRPYHCSFPFSCIPFSHISLAADLAQNFNQTHNIIVTRTRNPSEGGHFADCLWEVRILLPEYSLLLPITCGYRIIHHSPLPCIEKKNASIPLRFVIHWRVLFRHGTYI